MKLAKLAMLTVVAFGLMGLVRAKGEPGQTGAAPQPAAQPMVSPR